MPLDFSCPNCGAKTIVEDQFCGHTGPCFSCGKSVSIPYNPGTRVTATTKAPGAHRPNRSVTSIIVVIIAGACAAVVTVALVIAVAIPGFHTVRRTTQRSSCRGNLARIGKALQLYHEQHGSFPPAFTVDENGKRMHSWRVLILPQLNEMALYRQYRFDKPWDAPENQPVASQLPSVYGCPADEDAMSAHETSYMVVVGPRTPFPDTGESTRREQFSDPLAETLLVVEVATSGVNWLEPLDLDATQLRMAINPGKSAVNTISSEHAGGVHALFADGQVHWLGNGLSLEMIAAALTRDGREPFDWAQLQDE